MVNLKFTKSTLKDKIHACWLGKSIGGTLGGPYEGIPNILDVKGFATAPGKALVNDDLDLQLVWLKAMEDLGPAGVNERTLGEYWLTYITPPWNEYGICKTNLKEGITAPMSGEVNNTEWHHSNGAWIRTEIWACLYPGQPDQAIKYAYYDACIDHGQAEGTYGAIFVAALESAAFVTNDIQALLKIALSKIPAECRVAKSVRLVIDCHEQGMDWKDSRNKVVEDSADLGWFQAPANIAFVVLGLLYGNCDFKQSMLYAVNCGDDTDCTAATCGSILGIMYGMQGIPADWAAYIGDDIVSGCIAYGFAPFPKTCTELTEHVLSMLDVTSHYYHYSYFPHMRVDVNEDADDLSQFVPEAFYGDRFAREIGARKPYTVSCGNVYGEALIELESAPYIEPGGSISGTVFVSFQNDLFRQSYFTVRFISEDGFYATGELQLYVAVNRYNQVPFEDHRKVSFTIHAPEKIRTANKLIVEIAASGRSMPIYGQLVLFQK